MLTAYTARMAQLAQTAADGGPQALVVGDLNIAHTERDIRNWKGNLKKAGFLPEERAHLDAWAAQGWVGGPRARAGGGAGPDSWWRGRGPAVAPAGASTPSGPRRAWRRSRPRRWSTAPRRTPSASATTRPSSSPTAAEGG